MFCLQILNEKHMPETASLRELVENDECAHAFLQLDLNGQQRSQAWDARRLVSRIRSSPLNPQMRRYDFRNLSQHFHLSRMNSSITLTDHLKRNPLHEL